MTNDPHLPNTGVACTEKESGSAKVRLRYSLEELLGGITPDEAHRHADEVEWGPDVGREIIEK